MFDIDKDKVVFGLNECSSYSLRFKDGALGSLGYINHDLEQLRHSFISLGFHLYEFVNHSSYCWALGFSDPYTAIEKNFGLSRSSVSRYIAVFLRFSDVSPDGHTHLMFIKEDYKDYNFSQLSEMLQIDNKNLKGVNSKMTVKEIREYKKSLNNSSGNDSVEASTSVCDVAKNNLNLKDIIDELKKYILDSDYDGDYFAGYVAALDDLKKRCVTS